MAKRRRLAAPDAGTLEEMETGFAAKSMLETKSMAPISKVAGEAAAIAAVAGQEGRIAAARLQMAEEGGLLAELLSVDDIQIDFINRDRLAQDEEAMAELKTSILTNGQRTPIEVVNIGVGYGLISGWRRIAALQALYAETNLAKFSKVKAFVRPAEDSSQTYLNMVEENEIRADLTHYERGRIAVIAAGQGAYNDVEEAVNHLFQSASKAKRSKVRSFALIHEALGDLLSFPERLTEKAGLRLASALRNGEIRLFRAALAGLTPQTLAEEVAALEGPILTTEGKDRDAAKGGRPTTEKMETIKIDKSTSIHGQKTTQGCKIELKGRTIDADQARWLMDEIAKLVVKI
jgi:ParB family transcriptional regulator, chromosome partitioning protein